MYPGVELPGPLAPLVYPFEELPYSPAAGHCFTFSLAACEGSGLSTASPTLVTVRLLIIVVLVEDSYFLERQYFLHTNYVDFRKPEPLFKGPRPLSPTFLPKERKVLRQKESRRPR